MSSLREAEMSYCLLHASAAALGDDDGAWLVIYVTAACVRLLALLWVFTSWPWLAVAEVD